VSKSRIGAFQRMFSIPCLLILELLFRLPKNELVCGLPVNKESSFCLEIKVLTGRLPKLALLAGFNLVARNSGILAPLATMLSR
jgi:hypothetical protein